MFDRLTIRMDRDHQDGLRILAKQAMYHRFLMAAILGCNLFAAVFEGGTIGILAVAVSVLVDNDAGGITEKFGILGPYLTSLITELGAGGLFLVLVLVAVSAQILKSGFTYLGKYFSIKMRFAVNEELHALATRQVMTLTYAEVSKYPAGVLSALINQSAGIAALVNVFNRVLLTILMLLVYVGVMIAMSLPLTLSAIGVVTLLGFALNGVVARLKLLGERMIDSTIALGKLTFEFLQAPRLLRIFNATGYAEQAIGKARAEVLSTKRKSEALKAGVDPATEALMVASAGVFLVVGYLVAGERAGSVIPKLLLFVYVLNRMMPQVKALNQSRMGLVNMLPTVKRVASFLRSEDKRYNRRGGKPIAKLCDRISFDNVDFRYPDSKETVLAGISFSVPKGKTVALVGASGAGKSTIADLMLGLYEPTSGLVRVDGVSISELRLGDWRNQIGVVEQEVLLLNASVFENITFAQKGFDLTDVRKAATAAYADQFISALPDGYSTHIGDRGHRLSGGQQQRLALARALLRNPQILILDEATSALDSESEQIIQNTINELHHDRTMLVIAHRLSTLTHADNIVVLSAGRIVEQGTWRALLQEDGVFAGLWNQQIGSIQAP